MGQSILSVRMDEKTKKKFDAICADFGMNASVAVNLFAKAVLRERRIPFEIAASDDPFYSASNQAHLSKAITDLDAGKGIQHELFEDDVVVYPKKYLDELKKEISATKAKIASGEQPVFDSVDELFDKLETL